MRHPLTLIRLAAALALACLAACDTKTPPTPSQPPAPRTLHVAVVPKGTTHDFWKSVHAGAVRAEKETPGLKVTFRGPAREDDREQQVALVQNLVASKVDAIVLAPLDDQALAGPVKAATAAGVPVVIIDSGLQAEPGKDFVSFIATDNHHGGELAGARLGEVMGGKGRVLLLRYLEGSASTEERAQGFIDAIRKFPGIELVDPHRYAGATRATAQQAAENLLASNQNIDGVFCPNEPSVFGMLLALRSKGLAGKVKFVGFDASEDALAALAKDEMQGLVLQNPIRMGYLGVKTACDKLEGKPVELKIDTGAMLVTRDNMQSDQARELLSPNLDEMLKGR